MGVVQKQYQKQMLYVVVINYRTVKCETYKIELYGLDKDSFDVESWLNEHTDYNSDCYWMSSPNEIPIENHSVIIEHTGKTKLNDKRNTEIEHISNDVKEFASEVRKTIEDTYKSFGGSERFDFCDHGLALIEAVQNKLDEVLK